MRVISNALVSIITDKNLSAEGKTNASGAEKLMELLRGAKNGDLVIEAALKGIIEGKGKFSLGSIGNVEIPIPPNTKLPESGVVNIKFSLQNEIISANFLMDDLTDVSQGQNKTEDMINQLKQLGLPQTGQNLKALELLNEYHIEPSAEKIKQLAEGSFLASKATEMSAGEDFESSVLTKDQKLDMSKTLKSIVIQWLGQQTDSGKNRQGGFASPLGQGLDSLQDGMMLKSGQMPVNENDILDSAKNLNQTDNEHLEGIKSLVKSDTNVIEMNQNDRGKESGVIDGEQTMTDIKNLLKQLNPKQLLPLIASDNKLSLENLLLSDQVYSGSKNIGHLKESLVSKLSEVFSKLEPSKELIQDIVRWVEEDPAGLTFKNQLEQLETIITKHSPEAALEMKDSFEQLNKSMDFVQQMQNQMIAYHIPLQLGEHHTQVELYMNKRKGRQNQDEFKMFIALNTNEIGQVQVLITDQKNVVELQFKLETDALKEEFEIEKESLQESLENYTDKPIKLKFVTHTNELAILEAFKSLREDQTTSIDMRV